MLYEVITVDDLLPGQVGDGAGAEAQIGFGALFIEAQRLESAARPRAPEEDVSYNFV